MHTTVWLSFSLNTKTPHQMHSHPDYHQTDFFCCSANLFSELLTEGNMGNEEHLESFSVLNVETVALVTGAS